MKKTSLSLLTFALIASLSGCGSSSSSNHNDNATPSTATPTETASKTVKVIDGYVIGATVCDANNVCATTDTTGSATADFDLSTELTATGGTIDANNNQIPDDAITMLTLKSVAGQANITPMSDLVANGADADKLAAILGLSSTDALYADPIATNNLNLAKAIQLVYAAKLVDPTQAALSAKVNAYTVSTTTETNATASNSDLPAIGSDTKAPVVEEQNQTVENTTGTALPVFGLTPAVTTTANATTPTINIDALATMVVAAANNDPKVVAFVDAVKNATGTAADLETAVQTQKDAMVETLAPVNFNADVTTEATTTEANATVATDVNTTATAEANATDANVTTAATGSALPAFGSSNDTTTTAPAETNASTEANATTEDTTVTTNNDTGSALPAF